MSIFVGNLPFRAEREDVLQLFTPFGEVINCSLPLERDTGRKRGFAFIEMANETLESTAIESLQGTEMMGRPLRINKAEPRGNSSRRNYSNGILVSTMLEVIILVRITDTEIAILPMDIMVILIMGVIVQQII